MKSDDNIVGASIIDLAHPPQGGSGVPETTFNVGYQYQQPMPQGPVTLTFINITVIVPGDWKLTWAM